MYDLRNLRVEGAISQHIVEAIRHREDTIVAIPRIAAVEVLRIVVTHRAQVREVVIAVVRHIRAVAVHTLRTQVELVRVADKFKAKKAEL